MSDHDDTRKGNEHRTGVEGDGNGGYIARCLCGWSYRSPYRLAVTREAKAHRRYPNGNPRLRALASEARP